MTTGGMTTSELLESSPGPGVLQLTLNRPEAHNAISLSMQRALDAALTRAAADDTVRVVVIAGAGDRAFSAGYDLKELAVLSSEENLEAMLEREELLWRYLEFPKPTIAAVQGISYGGGTLLAACSDLRVGGDEDQHEAEERGVRVLVAQTVVDPLTLALLGDEIRAPSSVR